MFCRKCGAKLPDEAEFCHKCGTKMFNLEEQSDNQKTEAADKPDERIRNSSTHLSEKSGNSFESNDNTENEQSVPSEIDNAEMWDEPSEFDNYTIKPYKPKRDPTPVILIVVLAIAVIAIPIGIMWQQGVFNSDKKSSGVSTSLTSSSNSENDKNNSSSRNIVIESNPVPTVKEAPASDFEYEFNPTLSGIEIKKYIGRDSVVNIPSKIDGNNVVKIGGYPGDFFAEGAFVGCTDVTGINIPYGVREIGESAFSGCSRLTSITIPDSVTTIESFAFSGCTSLTSITIPQSVIKIEDYAFASCSGISEIIVDKNNSRYVTANGALYNKNMTKLLFYFGSKQGSVTIPYGVTEIGGYAFEGCYGLTNIYIPSSVTTIGYMSFSGCTGLTSIEIPYGVTDIGWSAFAGCSSLWSVVIPDSVKHIGQGAFGNCVSLTMINIPDSVESIDYYAFEGCYADIYYKGGIYSPDTYYMLYGTH